MAGDEIGTARQVGDIEVQVLLHFRCHRGEAVEAAVTGSIICGLESERGNRGDQARRDGGAGCLRHV
jgi:hypothetical protein